MSGYRQRKNSGDWKHQTYWCLFPETTPYVEICTVGQIFSWLRQCNYPAMKAKLHSQDGERSDPISSMRQRNIRCVQVIQQSSVKA